MGTPSIVMRMAFKLALASFEEREAEEEEVEELEVGKVMAEVTRGVAK